MQNFTDINALAELLKNLSENCEIAKRRAVFGEVLEQQLGFTKEQASLYAATVLGQNDDGSADRVSLNENKINDTWMKMNQQGMSAALLSTQTETWRFLSDLTCEHTRSSYEGYSSPFGAAYSQAKPNSDQYLWAPSDWTGSSTYIVLFSPSGTSSRLHLEWTNPEELRPRSCSINGEKFARQ
jgi:hypothetical protein